MKPVLGRLCFADNRDKQTHNLADLMSCYFKSDGTVCQVPVAIGIEESELVIKIEKGFDCLYLSLSDIKNLLKKAKT